MAGSRKPGPLGGSDDPIEIEDGTLQRTQSALPGPIGLTTKDEPNRLAAGGQFTHAASYVYVRSVELSLAVIRRETGCEVGEALQNRLPALVRMLKPLKATSTSSAAQSGAFGGSSLDLRIGGLTELLASLGLEFLPISNRVLAELSYALTGSPQIGRTRRRAEIDKDLSTEAEELAHAVGILMRVILKGIADYLRKQTPVRAAAPTIGASRAAGKRDTTGTGDEAVAQLVARLQSGQLGDTFAAWVGKNWKELLKNPRLREDIRPTGISPAAEPAVSQPAQRPLAAPASPISEPPTFSWDVDLADQAATLVAAAAEGKPLCPE